MSLSTTLKQVVGLGREVAGHAKKLPTKSEEIPIRSEQRRIVGVKKGEEIMNVVSKFDEHGDYNGT